MRVHKEVRVRDRGWHSHWHPPHLGSLVKPTPRLAFPTLAICSAAGLALVIAVGLQAPAASVGMRWQPTQQPRQLLQFQPLSFSWSLPSAGERQANGWLAWLTWAFAVVVALAILFALARVIRHLIRHLMRRAPLVSVVGTGADSGSPAEADARIVMSGLASALQILNSERSSSDAVVQAWQGLEDAAAAAGLKRRPAETASEFTVRILYRSRGSAEPIAVLLSLYQRVRFGHHLPSEIEIAAARSSLATLLEVWQADFPERRTAGAAR